MGETVCCNCGCPLNEVKKELPVFVQDDGGEGGGKREAWCPQCFVQHRAVLEPNRFQPHRPELGRGGVRAIRCTHPRCGMITVDFGNGACLQCRSGHPVVTLGPKPGAGVKGWDEETLAKAGLERPKAGP